MSSEEKALAGISHLVILFGLLGIVIALVIWIWQREKSDFAADHAKQALGYQIIVRVGLSVLSLFSAGLFAGGAALGLQPSVGVAGSIGLVGLLSLAAVIYGIYAAVQGFSARDFRYAVIGDFIERI